MSRNDQELSKPKGGYRFQKGKSGNPTGRPRGSKSVASKLLDSMGTEAAGSIMTSVIEAAQAGDMRAAEIVLARLWPVRRGRPIIMELPDTRSLEGLQAAMAKVVELMSAGQISTEEAASITAVLETNRKIIETVELQHRLQAVEDKISQSNVY